jgi:hypothetical protein
MIRVIARFLVLTSFIDYGSWCVGITFISSRKSFRSDHSFSQWSENSILPLWDLCPKEIGFDHSNALCFSLSVARWWTCFDHHGIQLSQCIQGSKTMVNRTTQSKGRVACSRNVGLSSNIKSLSKDTFGRKMTS